MTRAWLLGLALLPATAVAQEPTPFAERLAWYGVPAGADALSTHWARQRGRLEANPALRDPRLALGLQVASVPLLAWLDRALERRDPRLAWVLRGLRLVVAAWAVRENLRQ